MNISPEGANGPADRATAKAALLDDEHPWPGLAAYTEASRDFFHGRGREAAELLRLIRLAPLTALYGRSGLGKSSLLQAGLFPLLRAHHYLPVYVHVDFSEAAKNAPLEQVARRLEKELAHSGAECPERARDEGLWEYLHREDLAMWSSDNYPLTPVLVLDQFEELFSRSGSRADRIQQVLNSLADLIENRIPSGLAGEADRAKLSRIDLLSQRYCVVLSFREDFLPEVKAWEKDVPSLLRNYLRLWQMTQQCAEEAVQLAGRAVLDEGAAPLIVDFVGRPEAGAAETDASDPAIEPVLLSLFCTQLNRRRPVGGKIDASLIRSAGQDILDSFYREALDDPEVKGPPDVADFVETYLVQGERFRGDFPKDEALKKKLLTKTQLEALTDRHRLLRVVPYADTARIELIHDRLVPVVCKARDERELKEQRAEQERQAKLAKAELDKERARREELQRERDKARRNSKRAYAAFALCLLLAGTAVYFVVSTKEALRVQETTAVAWKATKVPAGEVALNSNSGLSEQTMYRALAAYRLAERLEHETSRPQKARAPSLSTLHSAMRDSVNLRKLLRLEDGTRPTPALAYSPDGHTLAVGGRDGSVRLLEADADTYREKKGRLVCPHSSAEAVWSLAFNGDGTRLAASFVSSGKNMNVKGSGLICVFDVEKREVLLRREAKEMGAEPADIYSVAFSRRAKAEKELVVSGGSDKMLRVWDVESGNLRHEFRHDKEVVAVAVSADGRRVAAGGEDAILRVWDLDAPDKPMELKGHEALIQSVMFHPADDSVVISAGDDGFIKVWKLNWKLHEPCLVQESSQQLAKVYSVDVNRDNFVAAAEANSDVRFFWMDRKFSCDAGNAAKTSGEPLALTELPDRMSLGSGLSLAVAFNRAGDRLASTFGDGSIQILAPKTEGFLLAELEGAGAVTTVAVSPDGKLIAAGHEDGMIHLWTRPENAEPVTEPLPPTATLPAHDKVRVLAFLPTGQLVSGGEDGVLKLWDPPSGSTSARELKDEKQPAKAIAALAVSPDGKVLAAGSKDGTIRLWDPRALLIERVQGFDDPLDDLRAVAFSPDGKLLIVGSKWRLRLVPRDGKDLPDLSGQRDVVNSVSRIPMKEPQEDWLLSAGKDGNLLQWQPEKFLLSDSGDVFNEQFEFRMKTVSGDPLNAMDASADGRFILTGGANGQVQLWDAVERILIGDNFPGHKSAEKSAEITAVALAPDGAFFVTADDVGKILLWAGPDRWADLICRKLSRNMSDQQWKVWISPSLPYVEQCPGLPKRPPGHQGEEKRAGRWLSAEKRSWIH